jgi:hypothetical protein
MRQAQQERGERDGAAVHAEAVGDVARAGLDGERNCRTQSVGQGESWPLS